MTPTLLHAVARKAEAFTSDADLLARYVGERDLVAFEEQGGTGRETRFGNAASAFTPAYGYARCPQYVELEELSLPGNHISSAGVMSLANSPHLCNLKKIDLTRNRLTNDDKDELRLRFGEGVAM